jgi:transcriptional regulator with XRE-family HTH domain
MALAMTENPGSGARQPGDVELGHRLRVEIALYGLRDVDVARRLGMDKGYLSRILAGKVRCQPRQVRRIILAIHADYLGGEGWWSV